MDSALECIGALIANVLAVLLSENINSAIFIDFQTLKFSVSGLFLN